MSFRDRLSVGTPLRFGELARYLGYSREQVRKWARAGLIKTVQPVPGAERRVPPAEARRLALQLHLLPDTANSRN